VGHKRFKSHKNRNGNQLPGVDAPERLGEFLRETDVSGHYQRPTGQIYTYIGYIAYDIYTNIP